MSNPFLFGISELCCTAVTFCLSFFYVFSNPGKYASLRRIFEGDELVHNFLESMFEEIPVLNFVS